MRGNVAVDVDRIVGEARDTMTVRRVFGEPIVQNGLQVIPAARIRGGAGGGSGNAPEGTDGPKGGSGGGGGFAVTAQPAGALVIRDGEVSWRPAINVERIVLASLALSGLVALVVRSAVRTLIRTNAGSAR